MSTIAIEDTVEITRQFKAPRDRVFAAFASPELMSQWFGGPETKVLDCQMDFRAGGSYRIAVNSPQMGDMAVSGMYREIVPPSKIVLTWKWEDDEDWEKVDSVITFEFAAMGAETELHMTHTGFPVPESRDNHGKGWGMCFDRLDALLAS
jgi:uncharacterized protein YndB with AHSA1/START domain